MGALLSKNRINPSPLTTTTTATTAATTTNVAAATPLSTPSSYFPNLSYLPDPTVRGRRGPYIRSTPIATGTSSTSWYWQEDDGSWKSYDGSSRVISSDAIEKSFQRNQSGQHAFSLNGCSYVIDFATSTQTNKTTGKQRKVERRLVQRNWYWQDDDGRWKRYDSTSGGVSSAQLTASYHANNVVPYRFTLNGCSYVIDFENMIQTNETTGKSRPVKIKISTASSAAVPRVHRRSPTLHDWYWQENDNTWHLFCGAISSDDIDAKFRDDPNGRFTFRHSGYSYEIDLKAMKQTNLSTRKQRLIKRQPKGTPIASAAVINNQLGPTSHDWFWQENDKTWHLFTGTVSTDIEAKYNANPNDVFAFKHGQWSYAIDFQTMQQTNLDTGKTRQILRKPRGQVSPAPATSDFPDTWDFNAPFTGQGYQLVDVAPVGSTAGEYQSVTKLFNKSMPWIGLKSVKRVQNKRLWEPFALAKRQLNGRGNGVMQLFHGANRTAIDGICAQGVDWRLSGMSNGTLYGKGSYFALKASYAKNYADSNTLILAQVLVGEFALGSRDITRPPPKDPTQPNGFLYDSCVDNLNNPTIFVVFERAHSYPEYVIEY